MRRALIGAAALLALAGPGHAYVRSRTSHGTPTAWRSGCVLVQPDSTGTPDLPQSSTLPAIQRSMAAWRAATQSCSYITLDYVEPAPLDAHFDGKNVIKFRTDRWCHPDDDESKNVCYASNAAGITTVFYADRPGTTEDGTLLDADVELNNVNFTFDVVDPISPLSRQPRDGTSIADLENTLVHELGHLMGLDHTCKDSATPEQEVDENGNPPPACTMLGSLPVEQRLTIADATMFNSAAPGETKKRSPEPDDVAGICTTYPLAKDPHDCQAQDISDYKHGSGGCAFAPGTQASLWPIWGLLAAIGLATGSHRRRRRLAKAAAR